jgi:hypothetical protein
MAEDKRLFAGSIRYALLSLSLKIGVFNMAVSDAFV